MAIFSRERLDALQPPPSPGRPSVLLVDDESGNLAVMRAILAPHYHLLEAGDGLQALERLRALPVEAELACIVSDHRMPHLTGVELCRQALQLRPQTSRIIVTGFVDIDTIIDSINQARIFQFIVKPFDAADFLLTVQRAVEAFQLQNELAAYRLHLEQMVAQRTAELQRANRELQAGAEQILELYNNACCGYHAIDRDGVVTLINDTELAWLGRTREAVVGKLRFDELLSPASRAALLAAHPQLASDSWLTPLAEVELELQRPDGGTVPVLLSASTVSAADGRPGVARHTVFDITQRKRSEAQMRHQAAHDALTGLLNRAELQQRAQQAMADAALHGSRLALVFIDLDHFKQINDQLGHHVGDGLLVEVAARLRRAVRHSDTVARLGGDEFVLLLPALAADSQVQNVARKVVTSLAQPYQIDGHTLHISCSAGISLYPDHGATLAALMELADAAMYRAKSGGRNNYQFHAPAV